MMLRLRISIFLLLSLFSTLFVWANSFACSCSSNYYEFSKVAEANTAIKGKVIGYGPKLSHGLLLFESLEVEVLEVMKGDFSHSKVIFEGDKGADCLHYADALKFTLGNEFLFIVADDEPEHCCGVAQKPIFELRVKKFTENTGKIKNQRNTL